MIFGNKCRKNKKEDNNYINREDLLDVKNINDITEIFKNFKCNLNYYIEAYESLEDHNKKKVYSMFKSYYSVEAEKSTFFMDVIKVLLPLATYVLGQSNSSQTKEVPWLGILLGLIILFGGRYIDQYRKRMDKEAFVMRSFFEYMSLKNEK
ncbi:hypothetical protein ACQV2R_08545 [Facklamia sp. P12937]|uniref:hypothetical protein n=1 Tax=Facklamia sp. P12937 TaxID=3421949 RepID=UPI003D17A037